MSNRSSTSSESAFDIQELTEIRARCRELRNDMLRDTPSQSFELIKRLEMHVKTLSDSCTEDKKRIRELERELKNCLQEIDYLQDQLNSRDTEVNYLGEHICSLQLKLSEMENHEDELSIIKEELKRSESERIFLIHELEKKDELISSVGLEYQCEIESLKLEITCLEQDCYEAKKSDIIALENTKMNTKMSELIQELEFKVQEMEKDNKDLMKKLEISENGLLISQLKEELRKEKLKAKEEAEDLIQEMAELRYQMSEKLEEECKRRACIEQVSLNRIAELENQLKREQSKSSREDQMKLVIGVEQIIER